MRRIVIIAAVAGCLLAQRGNTAESYDLRIARLEATVPQMQKQLDDVNNQLREVNKKLTDVQTQLAELTTEMRLATWVWGVVGGFLILVALKLIFGKPVAPWAPSYPQPVIYSSYPQPGINVEALVKRVLAEERARNQAPVQG